MFLLIGFIMIWKLNVIVVVVVQCDGKFLLVEEEIDVGLVFNQLVGYLEVDEVLVDVVVCEVFEEMVYYFKLMYLIGVYSWKYLVKDVIYLCFVFGGELCGFEVECKLDEGIVVVYWLMLDEVKVMQVWYCSLLILCCIEDLIVGKFYLFDLLVYYV